MKITDNPKKIEWTAWSLIVLSGAGLIYGAGSLPPAIYDPLGPAGLPRILGILIVALCALQLVMMVLVARKNPAEAPRPSWLGCVRVTVSIASILIYAVVLAWGWGPFVVSTIIFLAVMGFAMTDFSVRRFLPVLINAVIVGIVIGYVFDDLLHVVMPG